MAKEEKKPKGLKGGFIIATRTDKLWVKLTDQEMLDRGQQLARVNADISDHQSHVESVKKDLKAKEAELEAKRCYLAAVVRAQSETRDVEVQVEQDTDDRRLVQVIRIDTGAVIERRPMRTEESQEELPLAEAS